MKRSKKEAVALEYGQHEAPSILAKGSEEAALDLIAAAKAQEILVAEDPQLVAALSQVGLNEEIPEELYHAVAVMLSWAYWLKGMAPDAPTD